MNRIYIPKEIIAKLNPNKVDRNTSILVTAFNPERGAKRAKTKTSAKSTANLNSKEKINKNGDPTIHHSVRTFTDEEWEKIKNNANKSKDSFENEEAIKNRLKNARLVRKYGVANSRNKPLKKRPKRIYPSQKRPQKVKEIRLKENERHYKTEKPLIDTRGKDYYNYAGEYTARSVEFGHGRKKNWKGVKDSGLNAFLREQRQLQRDDPNALDRQAMK